MLNQQIAIPYPDRLWTPKSTKALKTTLSRKDREAVLTSGITGISVRLPETLQGPWWEATLEIATDCARFGLDFHAESWEGLSQHGVSVANRTEGVKDAEFVCFRLETITSLTGVVAKSYRPNFEWEAWRGANGKANPFAVDYIDGFAEIYHDRMTQTFLEYLGFIRPASHYAKSDLNQDGQLDNEIPLWLQRRFQGAWAMVYQSEIAEIRAKLKDAIKGWEETFGAGDFGAYIGVGRLSKGSPVGNAEGWKVMLGEFPQLKRLTHYVGLGAESMLLIGHSKHPPLVKQIPILNSLR